MRSLKKDGMIGERKRMHRKAKRMRTEKEGSSRKMKKRKTAVLLAAVLCLNYGLVLHLKAGGKKV